MGIISISVRLYRRGAFKGPARKIGPLSRIAQGYFMNSRLFCSGSEDFSTSGLTVPLSEVVDSVTGAYNNHSVSILSHYKL